MTLSNIFYFKKIVDSYYPSEKVDPVTISSVIEIEKENIKKLSDEDFIEMMISCFIPDLYAITQKKEKLFTKLTELMVGEWWRRIGGSYNLPTKKSGTEDVELIYDSSSIVCDAKVFRLGRSQAAPNVKDFLKLKSVETWINILNQKYLDQKIDHSIIGGLVTYPSLHEWENDSEVYEECTNLLTPVVMLPYEILALLLKYKNRFSIYDFFKLWNYSTNGVKTSRIKADYWNYTSNFIRTLLSLSEEEYTSEIKNFHKNITEAVAEYRKNILNDIEKTKQDILDYFNTFPTIESLKEYIVNEMSHRNTSLAVDYLKNINTFRHYKDLD